MMSGWVIGAEGIGDDVGQLWRADDTEALRALAVESVQEQAAEVAREQARCMARDRARLQQQHAELRKRAAALAADARDALRRETADEYRRAVERSCVADGQTLVRKRALAPSGGGVSAVAAAKRTLRLFAPEAWIWDEREAAQAVIDEDLAIQQHLVTLVSGVVSPAAVAPPRGTNRVCTVASTVDAMRLQSWMLAHTPPLFTTNIVATADFGTTINALTLVNRVAGASFNPRCFAAVKLRVHGSTHLIFSEGLVVCTGSKSTDSARVACIDTAQLLMRVGIYAHFLRFEVRNVVSTGNTGFDVDLAAIAHTYPINAHYMPDSFPGLMFRIAQARMVLIVFKSGCCILTGVKTRAEAIVAWTWLYCNILWHFQVRSGNGSLSDTEYGRRARQDESIVEQVCESVRDVTQSLFASAIAARLRSAPPGALPAQPLPDTPAETYFAALCNMTRELGARPADAPRLDLEAWLRTEAARAAAV
jgi:transcription initiation factor TFIID TATA-box-binding protein